MIERIGVVVPARDERGLIRSCLASLLSARNAVSEPVEIVVVLDRCQDDTAEIVAGFARFGVAVVGNDGIGVGAARATGVAQLSRRRCTAPGWIATTDADSRVPAHWFATQLRYARQGVELVAGTVDIEDWSAHSAGVRSRYTVEYGTGATHRHVHGANLSFALDAYAAVGGFDDSPSHEDVSLVSRFERAGRSIAWAVDLPVVTSARLTSPAPDGFSSYLRDLTAEETTDDISA